MVTSSIPVVDISCFFSEHHEEATKRAIEIISHACSEYGFFQIVSHGVPPSLMTRALELSKTFFELPSSEKLKSGPTGEGRIPTGYNIHQSSNNEFLMMSSPESAFNVFPTDPPEMRKTMEELFSHLTRAGVLVESILNDCLGLPPKFLHKYNNDRSGDLMFVWRYFPATEMDDQGLKGHLDGNCFSFVFQDEAGLEIFKDGEWIPVVPIDGSISVIVAEVFQVMSNNRFKSVLHRVVKQQGKSRHSYVYFNNIEGNKWIEPLPELTKHIGEPPKYRGFFFKDYHQLRMRNVTHPPSTSAGFVDITRYSI